METISRSPSHVWPLNTFSFVSKTPAVTLPAAPIPVKYASLIFSFWATSFNFAQILRLCQFLLRIDC